MSRDFADFLAALNAAGARYVVIGGIAVLALIPYRTTRDIDVQIEPTLENAKRVRDAVRAWGGIEPEYSESDFISGDILSFGGLLRIDIHSSVPGGDWETVWRRRAAGEFAGVPTHFASIEDLIAMKESAGRPGKDLPDVRRLKKLLGRKPPG
jgi:hypothetical protein